MAQKYKSKWTGPQVDSAVDQITDKIDRGEIGVAGGIASLGSDGKVPSWQLPTAKSVTADNFIGKDGITIDKAADSEKIEISGSGLVKRGTNVNVTNYGHVYGYNGNGTKVIDKEFIVNQDAETQSIALRTNKGELIANTTDTAGDLTLTNKKYVDDNFVAKDTTPARVIYAHSPDGTPLMLHPQVGDTLSEWWLPVYRPSVSGDTVTGNAVLLTAVPTRDYQCANKKYVDDAIAGVAESVSRYKHHVKFTFVSSTYNGSFFTDIYSNQNTVIDSLASLKTYLGDEFTKDLYGYLEYSNAYRLGNLITDTTVFYIQNGVGTQSISNFTISDTVTTI